MNDDQLLQRFSDATITRFGHEEHIRVAWILFRRHGADAAEAMAAGIRRLAEKIGASGKFHTTRTIAWMRLVAAADASDAAASIDSAQFAARHPELLRRDALDAHYSTGVLASDAARTGWVEPDLAPLPG